MVNPDGSFHQPYKLSTKNGFQQKYKKTLKYISEGMTPRDAVILVFQIPELRWYEWVRKAEDDIANGGTAKDSNLIKLIIGIAGANLNTKRRLERKTLDLALDDDEPNVEMIKFLLERRFGYKKKSQKDVEVSTKDDFNFNVNIVESKPVDKD